MPCEGRGYALFPHEGKIYMSSIVAIEAVRDASVCHLQQLCAVLTVIYWLVYTCNKQMCQLSNNQKESMHLTACSCVHVSVLFSILSIFSPFSYPMSNGLSLY